MPISRVIENLLEKMELPEIFENLFQHLDSMEKGLRERYVLSDNLIEQVIDVTRAYCKAIEKKKVMPK